ncbi:MAG: nucleotide exchange factor GrpE [Candidatus Dadabacteria bacterium]|nr:nucleotide exchange factor GrpE [Candidatus Dadabacteria bacterium]NIS09423.1 nucleotide exchange factor GrpE [Candidatus Dadabacteria bacterium]NIV42574.1 nucleotide exchange factor GrpE [Candidatus Dadabacteria bacterium]NIY22661.1 nucleotide exchange factor GrpE [Candidatus Dadabacteria bacterium]
MTDGENKDKDMDAEEIKINGNADHDKGDNFPDEDPNEKIKALQQSLDEKRSSYDDLYERYLRIAADFDNYKKRMSKEKTDLVTYGNEELIKALLNVIDNLERALEHSGAEGSSESIIKGVDLVYRQFISCLEKFGLSRIGADQGAKFDPNFHQAVEHVETDDIAPGLIVNEMIKGYLLKERLLRPSMVAVSKGIRNKQDTDNKPKEQTETEKVDVSQDSLDVSSNELELDLSDDSFNLDDLKIDENFTDNTVDINSGENIASENTDDEYSIEVNIGNDNLDTDDILELIEEDGKNKKSQEK